MPIDDDSGLNGRADPNERTNLLSRMATTDSGTPYYKHENKAIKYPFLVLHLTWEVLKTNYVNVFLVFVPIGILAGLLHWNPVLQFVFNFIAIIPLASLLAFATEELAVPLGQTVGGLLNATFGNAVELIVREQHWYSSNSANTGNRSALLRCRRTKSGSSRQVCWAVSCPISCWSWVAASSPVVSGTKNSLSTRQLLRPCRHS